MNFFTIARSVPNDTFKQVTHQLLGPHELAMRPALAIHACIEDLVYLRLQDMAQVVETVLYERAVGSIGLRSWEDVATEIAASTQWPTSLCTIDEAASIAVALTAEALTGRFKRLHKPPKARLDKMREKAIKFIARTQLYVPPEGMSLWAYFRLHDNALLSRKSIGRKEQIGRDASTALKELTAAVAQIPSWSEVAMPATATVGLSCCILSQENHRRAARPAGGALLSDKSPCQFPSDGHYRVYAIRCAMPEVHQSSLQ